MSGFIAHYVFHPTRVCSVTIVGCHNKAWKQTGIKPGLWLPPSIIIIITLKVDSDEATLMSLSQDCKNKNNKIAFIQHDCGV